MRIRELVLQTVFSNTLLSSHIENHTSTSLNRRILTVRCGVRLASHRQNVNALYTVFCCCCCGYCNDCLCMCALGGGGVDSVRPASLSFGRIEKGSAAEPSRKYFGASEHIVSVLPSWLMRSHQIYINSNKHTRVQSIRSGANGRCPT